MRQWFRTAEPLGECIVHLGSTIYRSHVQIIGRSRHMILLEVGEAYSVNPIKCSRALQQLVPYTSKFNTKMCITTVKANLLF